MDSEGYKNICSRPDVLRRRILEETLAALEKAGAPERKIIENVLSARPLPFPERHSGETGQGHYELGLGLGEAEAITEILFDLEALSVPADGIATGETGRYAELADVWRELTEYLGKNA